MEGQFELAKPGSRGQWSWHPPSRPCSPGAWRSVRKKSWQVSCHGQGSPGPSTDRCPHRGREKHVPLLSLTPSFVGNWVWAGQAWGGVRKGEGLHKHLLCLWVEFEE